MEGHNELPAREAMEYDVVDRRRGAGGPVGGDPAQAA